MKIEAYSNNPKALLNAIEKGIQDEDLKTWTIVKDANDAQYFTHLPEQWFKKVIIKPTVHDDRVTFLMTYFVKNMPDEATKGYYLGRFTEVLMVHYNHLFSKLESYAD